MFIVTPRYFAMLRDVFPLATIVSGPLRKLHCFLLIYKPLHRPGVTTIREKRNETRNGLRPERDLFAGKNNGQGWGFGAAGVFYGDAEGFGGDAAGQFGQHDGSVALAVGREGAGGDRRRAAGGDHP